MRLIGRKLVMAWDHRQVAIEIVVRPMAPIPDGEARVFDVFEDEDGAREERLIGPPAHYLHGKDMNSLMPTLSPAAWVTMDEWVARGGTPDDDGKEP